MLADFFGAMFGRWLQTVLTALFDRVNAGLPVFAGLAILGCCFGLVLVGGRQWYGRIWMILWVSVVWRLLTK